MTNNKKAKKLKSKFCTHSLKQFLEQEKNLDE